MKKALALLPALLMPAPAVVSCGNTADETTADTAAKKIPAPEVAITAARGE